MWKEISIALKVSCFTLLLTGLFYPFVITGFANLLFHKKAQGSLVFNEDMKVIGSELIGQNFKNPLYFFPRPSAAGQGYNGMASGGSNLGPTSQELIKKVSERIEIIKKDNPMTIPLDLVTTSGSGLDPHISKEAAYWQAPKIALHRNVSLKRIIAIIDYLTESPQFKIFGSERINVLKLNRALDQYLGLKASFL